MDRQIAMILAGATLVMGFGAYLMTDSMGEFDLNKTSKADQARVERLDTQEDDNKGPGLFAALMEKATVKLETSRNVYLGEHFPPTPSGWVLKKTHHDEIVDFTVDYKLSLDITDKSSMRRLTGWGGQSMVRTTDLAYHKGDKVIFMRLAFANKPLKKPLNDVHAWLFNGSFTKGAPITMAGARFETREYKGTNLINIAAETGYYTAMGVFTNASLAEVEALLDGMDMYAFASQTGNPDGKAVVPFLTKRLDTGLQTQTMDTFDADEEAPLRVARRKPSPSGNMIEGLAGKEEEAAEQETQAEDVDKPRKRKNLLSSLLGGDDEGISIRKKRKKKDTSKSGGSFQKVGNFTSRCQSGGGAKICRVDD